MQKFISVFIFSVFLMGCSPIPQSNPSIKLSEKDQALFEILNQPLVSDSEEWRNTYYFDNHGEAFGYPPIFEAKMRDANHVDLVYKDQPEENIFISVEVIPTDSPCLEAVKLVKTDFFTFKAQNVSLSDGRIAREACIFDNEKQFKMSLNLTLVEPNSDQNNTLMQIEEGQANELIKKEIELFDKIISTFSTYA